VDKICKQLQKMSAKEQEAYALFLGQLQRDYRKIPGCIPLKGKRGMYRVRIGRFRVIFIVEKGKQAEIIRLTKRNEKTYKCL